MANSQPRQLTLTDGARALVDYAVDQRCDARAPIGVCHWLLALCECQPKLVKAIAPTISDLPAVLMHTCSRLCQGDIGEVLSIDCLLALASVCTEHRGDTIVSERDLACVVLTKAGFALNAVDAETISDSDCDTIYICLAEEEPEPLQPVYEDQPAVDAMARPTLLLDTLGVDLTQAARMGTLSPIIGREEEIRLVIETLCRCTKRNPVLVGPAGVGKTAIVEGLAECVVHGMVPDALKDVRVIMLPVSALVANCKYVGEFEERMLTLLKEASHPKIILFIDEAHTILGAGAGGRNGNDLANIIKPALARGDIACIAATTDEEYRLFIESDSALERRFQPIRVQELSPEQTLEILDNLCIRLRQLRSVDVPEELLEWMVHFAGLHMHNRYFPDKAVDILEQCVAYGVTQQKTVLEQADIEVIAQRMVGMPLAIDDRLHQLRDVLSKRSLLSHEVITALTNRLSVTMRGFDLRALRPNAVILLIGEAEGQAEALAATIAGCLFGTDERVIAFDFSRFISPSDVTMLIGSPPGYIGYESHVTLHQVMQMPWCVLRCEHLHAGHPSARDILLHGLNEGVITLADGKRVYLSDTVIILTADISTHNPLGFGQGEPCNPPTTRERAAQMLGADLIEQVDIICSSLRTDETAQQQWLQESLLANLCLRFQPQGVRLCFDQNLLSWLLKRSSSHFSTMDWERLVEEHLCPAIIPHLPPTRPRHELLLRIIPDGDGCRVEQCPSN